MYILLQMYKIKENNVKIKIIFDIDDIIVGEGFNE